MADKINIDASPSITELCNVYIAHVKQERNTSSFASSSAASSGRHLLSLHTEISELGVLVGDY